jgi:hypothetical protein
MLDMPLVLSEKHCRMDRKRVRVWYPLEGPTFNKDLFGLVLVLKEFVIVADIKKFGADVIVERPFSAEFVTTV